MKRTLVIIAASWMSALTLAGLYICIGRAVDAVIDERALGWGLWACAGLCAAATGVSAWASSQLAGHSVGAIEKHVRHRLIDHVFASGPSTRAQAASSTPRPTGWNAWRTTGEASSAR